MKKKNRRFLANCTKIEILRYIVRLLIFSRAKSDYTVYAHKSNFMFNELVGLSNYM